MAKAELILPLIKSHFSNEQDKFKTLALQLAAHEAKIGHIGMANEIKTLVDKSRIQNDKIKSLSVDLQGLVIEKDPNEKLSDLIAPTSIIEKIERIIIEYQKRDKLYKHDLLNRRKILLSGPPGTGKTFTASIIASELKLPLYTILMEKMVTKYMGETSAKLRQIFDIINKRQGVYLFDEFDAIGGERGRDNDVGEMRRVLNSFLQFIERDESSSLIIAITNNSKLLDQALFRRFDDVIGYKLPSKEEKTLILKNRLARYNVKLNYPQILSAINGLSHAEITLACLDAIKETVLNEKQKLTNQLLIKSVKDRNEAYHKR